MSKLKNKLKGAIEARQSKRAKIAKAKPHGRILSVEVFKDYQGRLKEEHFHATKGKRLYSLDKGNRKF